MGKGKTMITDREPWRRPEQFNPESEGWARPVGRSSRRDGPLKELAGAVHDFGRKVRHIFGSDKPR
jgi:hypothetical protein